MIDFGDPPGHLKKRSMDHRKNHIPSLDDLDAVQLPNLAAYHPAPEPALAVVAANEDGAGQLSELLELSLSKCKEILELPLSTDDDDFSSILRAQVSSIQTVFNAQLRADEGRLRSRALDMMPKILEQIALEEKKLLRLTHGVLQ